MLILRKKLLMIYLVAAAFYWAFHGPMGSLEKLEHLSTTFVENFQTDSASIIHKESLASSEAKTQVK